MGVRFCQLQEVITAMVPHGKVNLNTSNECPYRLCKNIPEKKVCFFFEIDLQEHNHCIIDK